MRGPPGPKEEASGELAGDGDVERYELLRRCALGGDPEGHRFGLALLERRGVAAWARAWQTAAPSSPLPPALEAPADAGELVEVLASMALACLAGR